MLDEKKCIGDDTKAAPRQRPNYIKKAKKIWQKNDFQYGGIGILTPYNVVRLLKARL